MVRNWAIASMLAAIVIFLGLWLMYPARMCSPAELGVLHEADLEMEYAINGNRPPLYLPDHIPSCRTENLGFWSIARRDWEKSLSPFLFAAMRVGFLIEMAILIVVPPIKRINSLVKNHFESQELRSAR